MTPVLRLISIILLPWIAAFWVLRNRFRFRLFAFAGIFAVQLFAIAPMAYIAASVVSNQPESNESLQLARINRLPNAGYPLRISWYDPSLGGTNCDSDCSTMASGDKVVSWIGGRGGIFAAACPRSDGWHHGLRFELDGTIYECRDTGGWINCYTPGQIDLAIQNAHSKGYLLDIPAIAEISYCWVDLLNGSQYQYGSLAYNWSFVQ